MQDEPTSKTRRKKDMQALQDLGAQLVALNEQQLAATPLPEELRDAIEEAQRLTAHAAKRRQLQYIGRLMREADIAPIKERLEELQGRGRANTAQLRAIERWRDALLAGDSALADFLNRHPRADSQKLRALIRNARREQAAALPPKNYRELFRFIREFTEKEAEAKV